MKFLSVFALAFSTLGYGSAVNISELSRPLIREIAKKSIFLTLEYLHGERDNYKFLGPNLEEAAILLDEDAEFKDYKRLRLIFRYKAKYIMSAPDPMAELLKTIKYITEVFPNEDYERPLTCFLGLLASEGTTIFSPSTIPEDSHQPIIKELLLKISVDELNQRSHRFILAACAIYGYRDIFKRFRPPGYCDDFVAHTLYAFDRTGWGRSSNFINNPELTLTSEDKHDQWMIKYGFVEYFEKLTADKNILPEKRILIAKIAIRRGKLCTIRWYKFITKPEHSTLKAFVDPNIEPWRIKSIEEDFKSGRFLDSAVRVGSLKTIRYFADKPIFEIPFYNFAMLSIANQHADLFKYCLGKIDQLPPWEVANLTLFSLTNYNDEILESVLTLPNFDAKELAKTLRAYHGILERNHSLFDVEALQLFLPFFVKFMDEKNPDAGTDQDYEDAKLQFRKVLEVFLRKSSGSRQILEEYSDIDYVAEALRKVPADK